jgi:hypothetical protein
MCVDEIPSRMRIQNGKNWPQTDLRRNTGRFLGENVQKFRSVVFFAFGMKEGYRYRTDQLKLIGVVPVIDSVLLTVRYGRVPTDPNLNCCFLLLGSDQAALAVRHGLLDAYTEVANTAVTDSGQ